MGATRGGDGRTGTGGCGAPPLGTVEDAVVVEAETLERVSVSSSSLDEESSSSSLEDEELLDTTSSS